MQRRLLAAAIGAGIGAAWCPLPALAAPQSASIAVQGFGLVGAWSTDCAGAFRVTYAAPADAAPTVRVTLHGSAIAASEIRQILDLAPTRISWRSRITAWSLPDRPVENWMPQPGEIWETTLVKSGGTIRPMRAERADGQKVSVRDGFIYDGAPVGASGAVAWRNTGEKTLPLAKCPPDHGAAMHGGTPTASR